MIRAAKSAISEYGMLRRGDTVLCGVSGGADSMAMLHALCSLSGEYGIDVRAAHFNHRLRGADSDRDESFVRDYCLHRNILFYSGGADIKKEAERLKKGIEETARIFRYNFFSETARAVNADRVATAHTASDSAETVLLNLMRGTGADGLRGIPPVRGNIIRPLINCTRPDIEAYLTESSVPHVEDMSNSDTVYRRNLIRRRIIPVMESAVPGACGKILEMSGLLRSDCDYLNQAAEKEFSNILLSSSPPSLDTAGLNSLHPAIASRVIKMFIGMAPGSPLPSSADIRSVMAASRSGNPSARLSLTGGVIVSRVYGSLELNAGDTPEIKTQRIAVDGVTPVFGTGYEIVAGRPNKFDIISNSVDTFYIRCDNISGQIVVRSRMAGDTIRLGSGSGSKSLKKLFIDSKLPRARRQAVPVIADDAGVVAVYGFGVDFERAASVFENALRLEIREAGNVKDNG